MDGCSPHRHASNREVIVNTKIIKNRTIEVDLLLLRSLYNSLRSAAKVRRVWKECLRLSIENENRRENGRATIHVIGLIVSRVSSFFLSNLLIDIRHREHLKRRSFS